MRHHVASLFVTALLACSGMLRGAAARSNAQERVKSPVAKELLQAASQIAIGQAEHQDYWLERVLLWIGDVQVRAGDFAGAKLSLRHSNYEYGRNSSFIDLAEALAVAGQKEQAFEVLRELGTDHGWSQELIEDGVRLRWMDYLIVSNDLPRASQVVTEVVAAKSKPAAFRKLAVAYSKIGDKGASERSFRQAIDACRGITEEFDRAQALWEIADAQIAQGQSLPAAATIADLLKMAESFKQGWSKVAALRQAAVCAATNHDRKTATQAFQRALELCDVLDPANRINAMDLIAKAQAGVGYFDDALKTAELFRRGQKGFNHDGQRETLLRAIAIEQAKFGALADAIVTADQIKGFAPYKDDALLVIVRRQIAKQDKAGALTSAQQIVNPSMKATVMLKVAAAHAKANDKETAKTIASQIQLSMDSLLLDNKSIVFDYAKADTWGYLYEQKNFSPSSIRRSNERRAVELATEAMTLRQALGEKPEQEYAVAFKKVHSGEVIRAFARAHAEYGDAKEAFAWASRIGADEKIASQDDYDTRTAVEQRIYALVGVAEGCLTKKPEQANRRVDTGRCPNRFSWTCPRLLPRGTPLVRAFLRRINNHASNRATVPTGRRCGDQAHNKRCRRAVCRPHAVRQNRYRESRRCGLG